MAGLLRMRKLCNNFIRHFRIGEVIEVARLAASAGEAKVLA